MRASEKIHRRTRSYAGLQFAEKSSVPEDETHHTNASYQPWNKHHIRYNNVSAHQPATYSTLNSLTTFVIVSPSGRCALTLDNADHNHMSTSLVAIKPLKNC